MYDLKIINGRILDGTGAPWFRADLGVRGDTIVAIGDLSAESATATLDAGDNIVSPGFIDLLGWSHYSVLEDPYVEPKVRQGVTTEVTGEGFSPGPSKRWATLGDYLDHLDEKGSAINFALLISGGLVAAAAGRHASLACALGRSRGRLVGRCRPRDRWRSRA